ncbi:abortive infection system antitoxin AbiGi family protein [Aquirufa aurantiipilula]|uniref:abortive infection system antitoxin AbiGi family protein n=1 Tax=Aquirufa aurantiipilula TaxID=2696561 RepID=UPI001CAA5EFB|nr:abortive infection system antitoxin AbiGi family protein [Aquirufa aurantiipilula]MBZ1327003.1 hypothetical protein [Aquirufa aurantiipilula]
MARISSTTLFNFTESLDYLINNLREGFYCSNTFEKLPLRNNGYRVAMACFCDIPLSLIKEHFDWYGRYGIGIKRTYARELGVKPVWYVTSESQLVKSLIKNKELNEYERKHLLPYLKQFIGNQEYKDGKEKRKKFYDEREWRYIPNNSLVEPLFSTNRKSIPQNKDEKHRMKLNLSAIEYIIINKENEFDKITPILKTLSNENVRFEVLLSKIITSKQIERDF